MAQTYGLTGLRPIPAVVAQVASPPYDVIKEGSPLEALLQRNQKSLYHVILGEKPRAALDRLVSEGWMIQDNEPCYYVYEQTWDGQSRTGVLAAGAVTDYSEKQIIRHEKTFDDKVKGRIALKRAIGHYIGPVFLITRSPIGPILESCKSEKPLYDFTTDLHSLNDLHGIHNRLWRVPEASAQGRKIQAALAKQPLYIADGHHRYHAALLGKMPRFVGYVTDSAQITAYNRVVNGTRKFAEIASRLPLQPIEHFQTPPHGSFCLYSRGKAYLLPTRNQTQDVVERLDCFKLEKELYPMLGLEHSMIKDPKRFDYYPEWALDDMRRVVDQGEYDLAIALHPVSIEELVAVANAGLENPDVVMPEKSTFFAPKVLSGLFLERLVTP